MMDTKKACVCGRREGDPPNEDCARCQLTTVRANFRKYETWSVGQIHALHERLQVKSKFISELLAERNRLAIETNQLRVVIGKAYQAAHEALLGTEPKTNLEKAVATLKAGGGAGPPVLVEKRTICNG